MKNEQTNDRCWTLVPIQEKKQIEGENIVMKKRMATMALALTLAVSMIVSVETIPAKAVLNRFSGETVLEIPVLTESSAALVRKLLPASQSIGLMRAELDLTK